MSNFDLTRCTDPACPSCGCRQSEAIATSTRWGRPRRRRRCGNCYSLWWEKVPAVHAEQEAVPKRNRGDAVIFVPVRCPGCESTEVKTTHTGKRGVRYHKCKRCGETFKSVERKTP